MGKAGRHGRTAWLIALCISTYGCTAQSPEEPVSLNTPAPPVTASPTLPAAPAVLPAATPALRSSLSSDEADYMERTNRMMRTLTEQREPRTYAEFVEWRASIETAYQLSTGARPPIRFLAADLLLMQGIAKKRTAARWMEIGLRTGDKASLQKGIEGDAEAQGILIRGGEEFVRVAREIQVRTSTDRPPRI